MLVKKKKKERIVSVKVIPGKGIKDVTGTLSKKVVKLPPVQAVEIPIEKLFTREENIKTLMKSIRKSVNTKDPSFYEHAKNLLFFKEKKREAEQKLKRIEKGYSKASEGDMESLRRKIRIYERSSRSTELGKEQKYIEEFGEYTDKVDKIGRKELFDRLGKIVKEMDREKNPKEFRKRLIEFDRIMEHG
jgi:hypothetical protein